MILSKRYTGPVTCLEVCPWDSRLLFVGMGPVLRVFHSDVLVYDHHFSFTIHGMAFYDQDRVHYIALFGGKHLSVFTIQSVEQWILNPVGSALAPRDWILDVLFIHSTPLPFIIFAYSHNFIEVWSLDGRLVSTFACEEPCLLYACKLFDDQGDRLVIFCGTVFNQIIVWEINQSALYTTTSVMSILSSPPSSLGIHRRLLSDQQLLLRVCLHLRGHDGVLFNIRPYKLTDGRILLLSVSDDRTLRCWFLKRPMDDPKGHLSLCSSPRIIYGHRARLWDARLIEMNSNKKYWMIATISEDTTCKIWQVNDDCMLQDKAPLGDVQQPHFQSHCCLNTLQGHRGKHIRALAVSSPSHIFTGGGDASVKKWTLSEEQEKFTVQFTMPLPPSDTEVLPRDFVMVNRSTFIIGMTNGAIYRLQLLTRDPEKFTSTHVIRHSGFPPVDQSWEHESFDNISKDNLTFELLYQDSTLASYMVMRDDCAHQNVYVGNVFGDVLRLRLGLQQEIQSQKVLDSKVDGIYVSPTNHVFVHGGKELVMLTENLEITATMSVSYPISSMAYDASLGLLVVGHRHGRLSVYQRENATSTLFRLTQSMAAHHLRGVSHIHIRGNTVYTCGRDGHYHDYEWKDGQLGLISRQKVSRRTMDWIEGRHEECSRYLYGFYQKSFIVYNCDDHALVSSVPCGGVHRAWQFFKEKDRLLPNTLSNENSPYGNDNDDESFHFAFVRFGKLYVYTHQRISTATVPLQASMHGMEMNCCQWTCHQDSVMLITGSEDTTVRLWKENQCIATLQGHVSAVKSLKAMDSWLWTGGARGELFCFHEDRWVASFHHENMLADARFLSIDAVMLDGFFYLLAVSSDGMTRWIAFDEIKMSFKVVSETHRERCLLQAKIIKMDNGECFALTAGTDGRLILYSLPSLSLICDMQVHQNGIHCLDVHMIDRWLLILSGGDDQSICMTVFCTRDRQYFTVNHLGHGAAVRGAKMMTLFRESDHLLRCGCVSVGMDQRLLVFMIDIDVVRKTGNFKIMHDYFVNVLDISGMDCIKTSQINAQGGPVFDIVVVGMGMQLFRCALF